MIGAERYRIIRMAHWAEMVRKKFVNNSTACVRRLLPNTGLLIAFSRVFVMIPSHSRNQDPFNMSRLLIVAGLILGFSFAVQAVTPGLVCPPLRESQDPRLQAQLESRIEHLKLDAPVRRGQLAVALVDVTDPQHPSLAQVNGDEMMYAASLPKIAILLAAFERIHEGRLELDDENRELMTKMIRYSSNSAATAFCSASSFPIRLVVSSGSAWRS